LLKGCDHIINMAHIADNSEHSQSSFESARIATLPAEIRSQIYRHLLSDVPLSIIIQKSPQDCGPTTRLSAKLFYEDTKQDLLFRQLIALAQTSRTLRNDLTPYIYRNIEFCFMDELSLSLFRQRLTPFTRSFIQCLSLYNFEEGPHFFAVEEMAHFSSVNHIYVTFGSDLYGRSSRHGGEGRKGDDGEIGCLSLAGNVWYGNTNLESDPVGPGGHFWLVRADRK
jgi:hypothetical protein